MTRIKNMAIWDAQSTFKFLSLLVEHIERNMGRLPKKSTYVKWVRILQVKCDKVYDLGQLRSKYQRMRVDYTNTTLLKNHIGLRWDEEKQMATCSEEKWNEFVQVTFLQLHYTKIIMLYFCNFFCNTIT